jgi:UDP-N-acetylmuramate--alanine ligase
VADDQELGQVQLNVPGRHNVTNALACISLGLSLSIDFDVIRESLKEYQGVQRRFQLKGQIGGVWVIDDYAHHPTELRAILETAQVFKRSLDNNVGRIISIFQPHRYSRVRALMDEFAESLTRSDQMIITDIYAASEKPIEGITAQHLCQKVSTLTNKPVCYLPKQEIIGRLLGIVKPGDIVLTLGAGDITRVADDFVEVLKEQSSLVKKARL